MMCKRPSFVSLSVAITLLLTLPPGGVQPATVRAHSLPWPAVDFGPDPVRVTETLGSSSLMFIENVGQIEGVARFQMRGGNAILWLAEDALWFTLFERERQNARELGQNIPPLLHASASQPKKGVNVKLSFIGANLHPRMEPFERLGTHISYFVGNNPANWRTDIPVWRGVRYVDLYPGVDLELTEQNGIWIQSFVAHPGSDLMPVRLRVEGAESLTLDGDYLQLETAAGNLALPLFSVTSEGVDITALDPTLDATILSHPFVLSRTQSAPLPRQDNPAGLQWSTFLGGSAWDKSYALVLDEAGNTIITGETESIDFPTTPGAFDEEHNGNRDVSVACLSADGSELLYGTFLGGDGDDYGYALALDSSGSVVITGETQSTNFPVTAGAFDTSYNGSWRDAFVARLSPDGALLEYSTFLGGASGFEYGSAITLDTMGRAVVTGNTQSSDFPTTPGAFDTTHNGDTDAFVTCLSADGASLVYSTFLGGGNHDYGCALALDADSAPIVVGYTSSSNFPVTPHAFDDTHNGNADVFVTRLSPDGSALLFSSFLGGGVKDRGSSVAVDDAGHPTITGRTSSFDFPTTPGALDTTFGGYDDAFVTRLSQDGSALLYSTYLGGNHIDLGYALALDGAGNTFIVGETYSPDFPITSDAFDTTYNGNGDAFVARLSADGRNVLYGTFLGGGGDTDAGKALGLDATGNAVIAGWTQSSDFPITPNAFDVIYNGTDGFVTKLAAVGGAFLDLPVDYGGAPAGFAKALQNWNQDGGRITSWFDHEYPDYGYNDGTGLWLYNDTFDEDSYWADEGHTVLCYETYCYDGHNGFDFSGTKGQAIRAAADGEVAYVENQGNGGYGKHVVIYHPEGYFTLYGHLDQATVTAGQSLEQGYTLGTMGNTGRATEVHLHFGVYQDMDSDQHWDGEGIDTAVDPFGWEANGRGPDPWEAAGGAASHYLWTYDISTWQSRTGEQEITMTDATESVRVIIPPNRFSGVATFELTPGPVAGASAQLRSAGRSFWLRLVDWIPGIQSTSDEAMVQSTEPFTLTGAITFTVAYTDTAVQHLDVSHLALHHWDEPLETWQPLSSTVDAAIHVVTATGQELGDYYLLAPLLCPEDSTEPDDDYYRATILPAAGKSVLRILDGPDDEDWFRLEAIQGSTYEIETVNLANGVDTVVELYDPDGQTLLASDDDSGEGLASYLKWTALKDGIYFARVVPTASSVDGCDATYELHVTELLQVYLPLILRNQ